MTDYAKDQAKAQYATISTLVAALDCDFDRLQYLLEELRDGRVDDAEELRELEEQSAGYDSRDDVVQAIEENALSVEVRCGWQAAGTLLEPEQFRIVLCTGGPHVQLTGELDFNGKPCRAWLEYQDWGTPLTQYLDADQDVLLAYARCFYFGG